MIEQRSDGCYDQTASRLSYIKHLRSEHQRSPRTEADAAHVAVKTEMLQLRLMEKQRKLVRRADVNALIDEMCGIVLTQLSGMAARCSRDMVVRRNIDAVVHEVRRELAEVARRWPTSAAEPPLQRAGLTRPGQAVRDAAHVERRGRDLHRGGRHCACTHKRADRMSAFRGKAEHCSLECFRF